MLFKEALFAYKDLWTRLIMFEWPGVEEEGNVQSDDNDTVYWSQSFVCRAVIIVEQIS